MDSSNPHYYPKLYTPKEVAEILQISERSVLGLLKRHELAYVEVSVSPCSKKLHRRITDMDLQMFLDSRKQETRHERNARLRNRRRNMGNV